MAVTVKEIAKATGMSFSTVSNVLNAAEGRSRRFRPETRERIEHAARNMGYRRNAAAQTMANGRFGAVALLQGTNPHLNILPADLVSGIEQVLLEMDCHLLLARLPDEKLTDSGFVPSILQQWVADGLLVNYNAHIPQRMIELIRENQIPAVWLNSQHKEDCIYPDDREAAYRATRHLLELGHQRVAFANYVSGLNETPGHYSQIDRQQGYEQAMREAGLQPRRISGAGEVTETGVLPFTQAWMQSPDHPTAVLTYHDREAYAIAAMAMILGLRLPQYMSVVGFNAVVINYFGQHIDTMLLPEKQMGQIATEMLFKKIDDRSLAIPARAVPCTLERGETMGSV